MYHGASPRSALSLGLQTFQSTFTLASSWLGHPQNKEDSSLHRESSQQNVIYSLPNGLAHKRRQWVCQRWGPTSCSQPAHHQLTSSAQQLTNSMSRILYSPTVKHSQLPTRFKLTSQNVNDKQWRDVDSPVTGLKSADRLHVKRLLKKKYGKS